jgi:hypothetical protein
MSYLRIRGVLGLLLAMSLALPAYTCSGYRAPDGKLVSTIPVGADSSAYVATDVPHRPLEKFDATAIGSWLTVFAYLWPLLLLAAEAWRPPFGRHWVASFLGLSLPAASAWWICNAVVWGHIAYGAVLSLVVLGGLWLVALRELLDRRRSRAGLR